MIRRADVDAANLMRPVNNTFQTITAAADAIATADHRFPRATPVQKRRWGSCCSIYWCFGSLKQRKRIGHAVLVPEPSPSSAEAHENVLQSSPDNVLPFAAPPSSPVSFLQSELSSATQSPTAILSFTSPTANMYSPDGPSSIFAIGPFAYETQLVSPPLNFSTLTTEPSTPPFTPPESIHLTTTPSSPEVPFAQFLQPTLQKAESDNQYSFPNDDFQSYQFYPGSPISHLISPRSVISRSGASSPLPDLDFASSGSQFSNFTLEVPPGLLNLDTHSIHNWRQGQGSDSFTQNSVGSKSSSGFDLNPQTSESMSDHHATNESQNIQILIDGSQKEEPAAANHRFSFELSDEDGLLRSVESKPLEPNESQNIQILIEGSQTEEPAAANHRFSFELSDEDGLLRSVESKPQEPNEFAVASSPIHEPFETAKEDSSVGGHISNGVEEKAKAEGEEAKQHQERHNNSITLGSVKEFNFDNGNGSCTFKPNINADWWAKAKDVEKEGTATGAWSFFPMAQQ